MSTTQPMSEPARIAGVYIDPPKAFGDIAAHPVRWWVPLLLLIIGALAFTYTYSQRVGWERMMRQQFETSSRAQNMPPEQREAAIRQSVKIAGIMGYVGPPIAIFLATFICAGVLMLVLNSLMGGQISFAQSRAIVAYAFLTGLITSILSIIVMFIKSPEDFDIRNPLAFNAGAFLGDSAPKWLVTAATSFDVFSFWTIALLATGYAATSRKMTWSKAFTGIVTMWLVWVVVKTGWAAIFG